MQKTYQLIVNGGTTGCHKDNRRRRQWPQSRHQNNKQFSVFHVYSSLIHNWLKIWLGNKWAVICVNDLSLWVFTENNINWLNPYIPVHIIFAHIPCVVYSENISDADCWSHNQLNTRTRFLNRVLLPVLMWRLKVSKKRIIEAMVLWSMATVFFQNNKT